MICSCGNVINPDPPSIVTTGGWCAPTETVYDLPKPTPTCGDCKTRLMMMMMVGFDPGHNGANLHFPRGGITFGITDE